MNILRQLHSRFFSSEKELTKKLTEILDYTPYNISLYKQAFLHKSTTNNNGVENNNERLEYLGDAILGTVVAEYLFKKYPTQNEGFLTKMRSKIVKRKTLNTVGDKMGLDILLHHYNDMNISRSMMGNSLEALVGSYYLDRGYNKTKHYLIHHVIRKYLDLHELETYDDNYKSILLEWCQKEGKTIAFNTIQRYKLDKRDRFKIAIFIDDKKICIADDFNKKSAEQLASDKAIRLLGLNKLKETQETF